MALLLLRGLLEVADDALGLGLGAVEDAAGVLARLAQDAFTLLLELLALLLGLIAQADGLVVRFLGELTLALGGLAVTSPRW